MTGVGLTQVSQWRTIEFTNAHEEKNMATSHEEFDDTVIGASAQGVVRQQEGSDVKVVEVTLKHSEVADGGDGKLVLLTLTRSAALELSKQAADAVAWLDGERTAGTKPMRQYYYDHESQSFWAQAEPTGPDSTWHQNCVYEVKKGSGLPGKPKQSDDGTPSEHVTLLSFKERYPNARKHGLFA